MMLISILCITQSNAIAYQPFADYFWLCVQGKRGCMYIIIIYIACKFNNHFPAIHDAAQSLCIINKSTTTSVFRPVLPPPSPPPPPPPLNPSHTATPTRLQRQTTIFLICLFSQTTSFHLFTFPVLVTC